ncbi:MAG: hypothetical protein HY791_33345 [Deltaproteobacteria bacterium]|nr:hypothetical protein [Deltaproteobacteria bacterium]
MRCARCLAELRSDAVYCPVCREPVRGGYSSSDGEDPTEVIPVRVNIRSIAGLGEPVVKEPVVKIITGRISSRPDAADESAPRDSSRTDQVITDGRLAVQLEPADPIIVHLSSQESGSISVEVVPDPIPEPRPTHSISPPVDARDHIAEPLVRPGPFAALISEALGLLPRAESAPALVLPDEVLVESESGFLEANPPPPPPPAPPPPIPIDLVETRKGGRSQAEAEGWLDSAYQRPLSSAVPSARGPNVVEVPARLSDGPGAPLGPPPVRAEHLPLTDPDRQVRQAAELVLAALEAISDNKIGAAKNHVKLAMGFGRENPSYRDLESYIVRLEANRDPSIEALERRAAKLEADGQLDMAVTALKEAIAHAEEPQLLERLGLLIGVKQKRPELGIKFLERALKLRPKSKGYQRSVDRMKKLVAQQTAESTDKSARKGGKKKK